MTETAPGLLEVLLIIVARVRFLVPAAAAAAVVVTVFIVRGLDW